MTSQRSRPGNAEAAPQAHPRHTDQANTDLNGSGRHPSVNTELRVPETDPDADTLTAALDYAAAGWYVLPVKRGTKDPGSIEGKRWQDKSSRDPKTIAAWFASADHGIALHCGRSGAVVFDVDNPDALPDVLCEHLKAAPFQSTRADVPGRGHYVFAMPAGRTIGNGVGRLGGGWGEICGLNSVIMAAPSHHAGGGRYQWESAGALAVLPAEVAELVPDASPAEDAATDEAVAAFINEHTDATRPELRRGWIKALHKHFATGSRHDGAVSVVTGALKESRCGYLAADTVIDTLRQMFNTAVTRAPTAEERQRTGRQAADEWKGIVAWAVAQANAADLMEVRARTNEKMPSNDTAADDIKHSAHLGMAIKLGNQFEGKLLYVNKVGWHRWDGKRYAHDGNGAARRAVHSVIKRDRRIVKSLQLPSEEEEKRLKQIARYETASAITGILTEAAALEVFSVEVSDLDADPYLFNCANGTLDLRTMELRLHDPADRITKVANAAYHRDAVGTQWPRFLEKVLPGQEVRDYLQRLCGVSLLGEVNGDKQILPIMVGSGATGRPPPSKRSSLRWVTMR